MDKILNSKTDKQTIYDIYRACRLCGAGAGYKMPIIQNVVDLDTNGIELKQKIRDCVQIEVTSDDKMPPLICELCVDKVNDFYEFMELCQQTNKRTRTRLGLPLQTAGKVRNAKYDGDCILGVTEPVYGNEDSDEPLSTSRRTKPEPKVKIKVEKPEKESSKPRPDPRRDRDRAKPSPRQDRQESRREAGRHVGRASSSRSPSPEARATRRKRPPTPPPEKPQPAKKAPAAPPPKSILKKETKSEEVHRPKRSREQSEEANKPKRSREPPKPEVPQKKVKLAAPSPKPRVRPPSPAPKPRARPPSPAPKPRPRPPSPPVYRCTLCAKPYTSPQALGNHMRSHTVSFTPEKLACNACGQWFVSVENAAAHHAMHKNRRKPYQCRRCGIKHTQQLGYDNHIENGKCIPWDTVPDVKCEMCWRLFPTMTMMGQHRCGGVEARPGGKCSKCKRSYTLLKNLKKHEESCTASKKSKLIVDPEVMKRISPSQVRVVRCDALLKPVGDHYDVSDVPLDYGVSRTYRPRVPMVSIKAELTELAADEDTDLLHWDSDDGDGRTVDSLSTLSLKTIFSKKVLGKVPKKRRVTTEKNAFDSTVVGDFDDFKMNIDNIIDNLGNEDQDDNASVNSESLLCNDVNESVKDLDSFNDKSLIENDNDNTNTRIDSPVKECASTDCESETENVTENKKDINSPKLSISDNDLVKDDNVNKSEDENKSNNETSDLNDIGDESRNTNDGNKILDEYSRITNEENTSSDLKNIEDESRNTNDDNKLIDEDSRNTNEENTSKDLKNIEDDSKNINDENILLNEESRNTDKSSEFIDTDIQNNREISETNVNKHLNDIDENKELMDALDEQIGETEADKSINNDGITENNEGEEKSNNDNANTEEITNNDDESHKDVPENYELVNKDEEEANEQVITNNDDLQKDVTENYVMESKDNDESVKKQYTSNDRVNDDENNHIENMNTQAENEAISNDIENKINDLIALNSHTENNDGSKRYNDEITNNTDNLSNNHEIQHSSDQNDVDKEKISLDDLLPPKDNLKSMDLDSISDEDFDFDA